MTKILTDYEIDKEKKKQKLVRNEFMSKNKCIGKFEFPIIKKQDIDIEKIEFISFNDTKLNDDKNKHKTVHFFTYDWLFEKVYEDAEKQLEKLRQYRYLLSPDFSIFTNMPLALQIESIFKNRWCGAYWQSKGLKVIPTVSWGDEKSFDFCFDGIEKGSVVAVCTYYRENCEREFMLGYNEMLKRIKPSKIICYDEPFKAMTGDVIEFLPTTYEWTKSLSWQDQIQFKWEKHNRNVIGLNKKDFKFFDYDDPYALDQLCKCSICGGVAQKDQFGNGECNNCGWEFSADEKEMEDFWGISYPMLISPTNARKQYKQGKPFKASFEEFINGLKFYSEVEFEYLGEKYGAFFYKSEKPYKTRDELDGDVEFFKDGDEKSVQKYKTVKEFKNNGHIDGQKLKDIWNDVTNAGFMC